MIKHEASSLQRLATGIICILAFTGCGDDGGAQDPIEAPGSTTPDGGSKPAPPPVKVDGGTIAEDAGTPPPEDAGPVEDSATPPPPPVCKPGLPSDVSDLAHLTSQSTV